MPVENETETHGLTADLSKFIITEDGAIVDPESGEVLGYQNAPLISDDPVPDDVDPAVVKRQEKELVEFYIERRARAIARKVGIEAEMNLLLAGIRERFESKLKEEDRKVDFLDHYYGDVASRFTTDEIAELAAKSKKAPKSVKLNYATLGFRATKGKTEIKDHALAAFTLLAAGEDKALRFTVDVNAVRSEADEKEARYLLETLKELLDPILGEAEIGEERPLEGVKLFPGVSVQVMAGLLPDELPETVRGISKELPKHPLGKFYVDHGGKS